jgi:hypothetical protein
MKLQAIAKSMAAGAVALLIAGCGGGGGSNTAPSLQVSGTAATGAAMANADVQVKCAAGTGTATTTTSGGYTVSITGGQLPCIIKVSGNGGALVLHSVADAAAANASGSSAVANVTPLTEMIVAQLTGAMPNVIFAAFDATATGQITTARLTGAITAVTTALKDAGIDLGTIDPFKAQLVPASSTATGNAYDQLLDLLGTKITPEALPLLVNQIATAAVTQSATGLTEAMTAVSGGSLEGCPVALSGKYRTLDYWGRTVVREVDFKKKTFMSGNGTDAFAITTDAAKPCEFTASGTASGTSSEFQVVIGPNGVGTYKARNTAPTATAGVIGYIFPVQAHPLSALAGTWSYLQSGYDPIDGNIHWPGKMTFNADNQVIGCDYDTSTWACVQDDMQGMTVTARTDGGFDLNEPGFSGVANIYGYRAPNGSLTVFGTTNAAGATGAVHQTSIVATKLNKLELPAVGRQVKYWDTSITIFGSSRTVAAPVADANTVIAVDTATSAVTRKRSSDGREDVARFNTPLDGLRTRDAGTWNGSNFAAVYQIPVSGLGITISVNKNPSSTTSAHIYNLSVGRP